MTSIIKVDTIQDQGGNNIINENANTITIGASGDTITIPSGATLANNGTATGFASIDWQAVKTTTYTASAQEGIFADTSSGAWTLTLPAGTAGATVIVVDYAGTFGTHNLTISPNGSEKIEGSTGNRVLATSRQGLQLVYADSTQGWTVPTASREESNPFYVAPYDIEFLVVAGGGGAAADLCGGGGAGGYRTSTQSSVTGNSIITITVGDGGAGNNSNNTRGASGSDSSITGSAITNITSAGGGAAGVYAYPNPSVRFGLDGGSGGGGGGHDSSAGAGGSGNTPSTSPSQGNNGAAGTSGPPYNGGGGGGATNSGSGANGGNGTANTITGSSVTYAGGGGGCGYGVAGSGGSGGGGAGTDNGDGNPGTANTGGGGGSSGTPGGTGQCGSGGKGVVILKVPTANYSGTSTGSPTVTTSGSDTIIKFTGSGSYTT